MATKLFVYTKFRFRCCPFYYTAFLIFNFMAVLSFLKYHAIKSLKTCFWQTIIKRSTSSYRETFKFSELKTSLTPKRSKKPDASTYVFGKQFSDHMFQVEWQKEHGWGIPQICPLHNLDLHPASKVFHYAQELFEGLKAFRTIDNKVMLFRPDRNIDRMLKTAERASLPLFDGNEFLQCLKKLISIEQDWVPREESYSLYIRPTFIAIEPSLGIASANRALLYIITGPVGPYFATGSRTPVSLYANPQYVRSWIGGVGDKKMGANYGPTIFVQREAEKKGHQQVLWLYGDDHLLSEVGTMNIFVYLINENGDKELVTPPLDGTILPGIVRQTLLELAREWGDFKVSERKISMKEVTTALEEKRLLEIFGSGTACNVCPVGSISYLGRKMEIPSMENPDAVNTRFFKALSDIQAGRMKTKWMVEVD